MAKTPKLLQFQFQELIQIFKIINLSDIGEYTINQLKHFIEHHKELEEGKFVKVKGFKDKEAAKKMISYAIEKYKEKNEFS